MGAVFAPTRFSSVRISIRDLVADGKSLVRNSGVGGGGQTFILRNHPPASVEKSCVWSTSVASCVVPHFVAPRFVAWHCNRPDLSVVGTWRILNSGESNRPLTPILLKRIVIHLPFVSRYFCKSMPSSWQKVVYTPSRYLCRSIRVRGRWNTPSVLSVWLSVSLPKIRVRIETNYLNYSYSSSYSLVIHRN